MKKLNVLVFASAMLASASSISGVFYEAYSGAQGVREGRSYDFGFDMWYDNDVYGVGTNSSLDLVADAEGAFGAWENGLLEIDLWSSDRAEETTYVSLEVWNRGSHLFNLGTYNWDGDRSDRDFSIDFTLTEEQLALFDNEGWGEVTIAASVVNGEYNDFRIDYVALTIETVDVAEPASLGLVALGLIGLGAARRRIKS
ncbi:MAG: PEP-CTERM sorting domain-containing protein [Pseudomonadales bacterium]|nr:PEP-CTERM sorting domain-containing protein [Pseudomonadales bacterium]